MLTISKELQKISDALERENITIQERWTLNKRKWRLLRKVDDPVFQIRGSKPGPPSPFERELIEDLKAIKEILNVEEEDEWE